MAANTVDVPNFAFGLNQRTAPRLSFAAFLDLALRLGCVGVEARNDMGRPVFDGLSTIDARRMAEDRGLRFLGLSEVYPFDDWTSERRNAVAALIELADAVGAETVSLIPRVDGAGPTGADRAALHVAILQEVAAMAAGTSVTPLVEPIGFPGCSIRHQREAADAIEAVGGDARLGILHDTFQHALAGDDELLVPHIRLVHISGISGGTGPLTQALDGERVLVDSSDRAGTLDQMQRLVARGYGGAFSFECTTPAVQDRPDLEQALARSIAYLDAGGR